MLNSRRTLIGFVVSAVFLLLFLRQLDGLKLTEALAGVDYRWVVAGIPVYFLGVWVRTLRWQVLMRSLRPLPARGLFTYVVMGYMANDLMPARSGEVVRAYLTGRRYQLAKSPILGTVALERISDGLTLLLFLAVAAFTLPLPDWIVGGAWLMAAGFVGGMVALVAVVATRRRAWGFWQAVGTRLPAQVRGPVGAAAGGFIEGMGVLHDPRLVGLFALHAVLAWVLEVVVFYLTGLALGIDMGIAACLVAMCTANLVTALPSSQAGIGPFELACSETLKLFGLPPHQAVAFALLVHVVLIVPVVVLGLLFLTRENLSLRGLVAQASAPAAQTEVR